MTAIRRILVPVDFSTCSNEALEYAIDLAAALDAKVTALHVWEMVPYFGPAVLVNVPEGPTLSAPDYVRIEVEKQLQQLQEKHRIETRAEKGVPTDTILRVAEELKADLVVIGTNGRTGLAHMILGSVAEKVLRRAHCPVIVVRENSSGRARTAA